MVQFSFIQSPLRFWAAKKDENHLCISNVSGELLFSVPEKEAEISLRGLAFWSL